MDLVTDILSPSEAFRKAHSQGGKTAAYLKGPPRFQGWEAVL